MKKLLLTALLTTATFICLHAQDADPRYAGKETFPFGVVERISSEALSEERVLNIYLPQGYHPDSAARYPVIYVLDGSSHEDFPHIAGLAQFMNMYELLPKSIVVGIANVDRYRDFTYPSKDSLDKKYVPTMGGSAKFMRFLEEEALPFIDQHYLSNGKRTIIGQSLGGLLATEVLFKKPQLFADYIIVSPSLWWDQQAMVKEAGDYLRQHKDLQKRIFVSLGEEHPEMHKVADMLVEAIRASEHPGISLTYTPILEEDHATILHRAVYAAFQTFYPKKKEE